MNERKLWVLRLSVLVELCCLLSCMEDVIPATPTALPSETLVSEVGDMGATPIRPIASLVLTVLATPTAAVLDQYTVCADSLNVRSVPAAQDGVITWLTVGAHVTVYDVSEGWGRISPIDDVNAQWVNTKYLCK